MPDDGLRDCVRSVLTLGRDLDATSIAEVLWLAAAAPVTGFPVQSLSPDVSPPPPMLDIAAPRTGPDGTPLSNTARPTRRDDAPLPGRAASGNGRGLIPSRQVRVQHARPLLKPLDLARSLRPLKRQWPVGRRLRLDIDATVRAYARTWQLIPEFRPAPERWFELDLVLDDSPSMAVWTEVVTGLITLLNQLGAFWRIRTWQMSVDATGPVLRNEGGQPSRPDQLRAPNGRRLIIVVTDGAAPGWFRPGLWQLMRMWAGATPTVLISPLATRLWRRTGLDLPAVRAGSTVPGSPSARLRYSVPYLFQALGTGDKEWLPIPVATLSPHMLGQWAKMLMRADPQGCDALLVPVTGRLYEEDEGNPGQVSGRDRVEAFRQVASPKAARLAILCAPFTEVTLPLLRLIQQELVPGASTEDLAEVIVGGLFLTPIPSPDDEVLHFREGVQSHLRELLGEFDAWHVYEVLKHHVSIHSSVAETFMTSVEDPLGDIALPSDLQPFALASRDALEFLGAMPEGSAVSLDSTPAARDYTVKIRALVVDDDPRRLEYTKNRLGREIGWDVEWETATDVDEGQRLMASSAAPFDLVIADLMFPREDNRDLEDPRGLDLIRDASRRSARTFILATSVGRDYLPDLMENARRLGAHHAVLRREFSKESAVHSPAAIAAEIRAHLLDNGTVSTCEVVADPLDPGIQGLLHQVSEATIARLYSKILDAGGHRTDRIELRFLTPGAPGASICTVTAYVYGIGRMSHILKLSQAQDLLTREAERGRRAAEVLPPPLLVQHRPPHAVGPVNGWYALGGPLIERATTLRGWLAGERTPEMVSDVLEALFADGLAHVYAEGRSTPMQVVESFGLPTYLQRNILQALEELREALERDDGGGLAGETGRLVRVLTAFVTESRLPGITEPEIPRETYVCYAHGDLHGANVLVSTGHHPWPQLIDPSHFGVAHWATDPALLAVDLLMRSVDAGTESMLFTGFSTWRTLASRFGPASRN